jgi:L-alanine-DL-glutamate epimerase-like enolase superfamily enzyme
VKIEEIRIFRIDLPLSTPFQHSSSGQVTALEEVVAAIQTDTGIVGYGEVRGNCTYVTGDTPDRVVAAANFLAPLLIGESLENFASLIHRMEQAIVGNSGAKALLDIALHDAYCRAHGIPVSTILGGRVNNVLPTDASIPFAPPEEAGDLARAAVREGFAVIKVRVGKDPVYDDARLAAVRDVMDGESGDSDVLLSADANGAWDPKDAVRILSGWEKYRLSVIEQPVGARDIEGLRFVRENVPIPVMADESAKGPREVMALIHRKAVDMLHFKLIKAGGFTPLRTMMSIAEASGIPYMIGQMDEGMLATAAAVQAGAASRAEFFEVHGYKRVALQPFKGLEIREGSMIVPDGSGLGVEVDESAMRCVNVVNKRSDTR